MEHCQFFMLSRELRKLYAAGLYDSVEILAQLYLSSSSSITLPEDSNTTKNKDSYLNSVIECNELIGDALYAKKEIKRALSYYRISTQQKKYLKSPSSRESSSLTFISPCVEENSDISLILKECQCLIDMKDSTAALSTLEIVPQRLRNLRYYLIVGELYMESNLKEKAKSAFKEALTRAPLAIEIVRKLVGLGVDDASLIAIVHDSSQEEDFIELLQHEKWYNQLISVIYLTRTYQVQKGVMAIQKLLSVFPKNCFLLTMAVQVHSDNEQLEQSNAYYQQLRRTDPMLVDDMDKIALLLFHNKDDIELSQLASDVITSQPNRPEGYNIAALYSAIKEEFGHALAFVEKACALKPKHPGNYITRGRILFLQGANYDSSLISFTQANTISPDLLSFTGLIESNVALGKLKDAARSTREMAELYPKSAEACYLLGTVLAKAKGPDGVNASINAYSKALKINPRHKNAAIALCSTYLAHDRANDAIECLLQISAKLTDNKLRILLAKAYGAVGRYAEAMEQLQLCTHIPSKKTDPEVLQEIEHIEAAMKTQNGTEEEQYIDDYGQEQYSGDYEENIDEASSQCEGNGDQSYPSARRRVFSYEQGQTP